MMPKILVVLVLTAVVCVNCAKYPKEYPLCKQTDSKCMLDAAKTIVRAAAAAPDGIPALGIPRMSPLLIDGLTIKQGADSPVNIELIFKNALLTGFEEIEFTKIAGFDKLEDKKEIVFKQKKLALNGDYSISGRVLVLPIQGVGKCNLTLDNPEAIIKFTTKKVERNGKTYIQTDKFKMTFTTTRLHTYLGNLFKGDKALGDNTNLFLNENWEDIFNELRPNISKTFGVVFESIINNLLNTFPYNELFSE